MPVANVKNDANYDIVVKSLRRREVSCLVAVLSPPVTPEKNTPSKFTRNCESGPDLASKLSKYPKKEVCRRSGILTPLTAELPNKRTKSFGGWFTKNSAASTPEVETPKRQYRRKVKTLCRSEPKTRTRKSAICLDFSQMDEAVQTYDVPKKRAYRKKNLELPGAKKPKKSESEEPPCLWMDDNANAPPTPLKSIPRQKRSYCRSIPPVPHNTPVVSLPCRESESSNTNTCSSLWQVCPSTFEAEVQGKTTQKERAFLQDDVSTCTGSSASWDSGSSSTTVSGRRGRRPLWIPEEEEEEEEVSEYELLRRKNIEENLKVLRQMFAETGFEFEKKPETPKSRKNYSKVPPPPPRPKSARLEIRGPLDFSQLTHTLSLT